MADGVERIGATKVAEPKGDKPKISVSEFRDINTKNIGLNLPLGTQYLGRSELTDKDGKKYNQDTFQFKGNNIRKFNTNSDQQLKVNGLDVKHLKEGSHVPSREEGERDQKIFDRLEKEKSPSAYEVPGYKLT